MSGKRFTLPVAVFLLLVKDEEILLMRRQNTGWHDGDYDLVAGHLDGSESLTTALCREAAEEIGITVNPADATFTHLVHAYFDEDGKEYLNIFFEVKQWQGEPSIMGSEKCDELRWFSLDKLPTNLTPSSQMGLRAYTSGNPYSELGFK